VTFAERVVALEAALAAHDVPHAFGGAIALAYLVLNPRATSDVDVNLFVPTAEAGSALAALPDGVAIPDDAQATIERDGQIRLWWEETPVDLFFDYAPIHAEAARNAGTAPFAGITIPVLGPVELAVFKAMFDRSRDWADIEDLVDAGTLDLDAVRAALRTMLPPDDPRFARLDALT